MVFEPWSENGYEFWTFWPEVIFSCLSQIRYRYRFFGGGLLKIVAMATNNMYEVAHRAFD